MHAHAAAGSGPLHDLADAADHLLGARHHRAAAGARGEPQDAQEEGGAQRREAGDHLPGDLDRDIRLVGVEQEQGADGEGGDAAEPDDAEARHEGLRHHQGNAEDEQRQAGVADRQQRESGEPHEQADAADHAGGHRAGVPELEQDAVDADHHQDERDVGVGDHLHDLRLPVGLQLDDAAALGREPHLAGRAS